MQSLRGARISIFAVTATLVSIGVVMIYSSSAVYAYDRFGDNLFFLKRHIISLLIGLFAAFIFMTIDLNILRAHSKKMMFFAFVMLILVLIPGVGLSVSGARRWLKIGFLNFQPVEVVKPALLIYLADFLDRKSLAGDSLVRVYLPALFVISALSGLVIIQPDLGSSVELAVVGIILLYAYGAKIKHLFMTFIAGLPLVGLLIISSPYRFARIMAFVDPWKDPKGTGFQMIQSFTALGSGGIFGVGLGNSKQKLFYLPESHTDFIFSIIGEEMGFVGAGLIVILFGVLIWNGMRITFKKGSEFSRLLAFGITSIIGLEAIINIGVSTGSLPTKGLPLPFLSYGGTSLVTHMMLIGMLLNLGRGNAR
ncbi:MAG: putative lipid II flippase FtsW [Candidatus Omnitrophica bacterium]|nr:putative lipid II flippase FtsW [Candidatus Omnitrophota bacterium]